MHGPQTANCGGEGFVAQHFFGNRSVNFRRFANPCQCGCSSSIGSLSLAKDVEIRDGSYFALSETPWLRIDFKGPPPTDRWIRLTYVASFFDPLARPVIRCFVEGRHHDEILPAALLGRAMWLGHIPQGTHEIWISPTNRIGAFGFAIESLARVAATELVWRCLRRNPLRCLAGLAARVAGLRTTAETEFRRVLSATRLEDYAEWRKLRLRDLDLTHLDRPRTDWQSGPRVRFITTSQDDASTDWHSLVCSLARQPYPRWSLAVVCHPKNGDRSRPANDVPDAGIVALRPDATVKEALEGLSEDDLVALIAAGDRLPAYAVGVLAEAASRSPAIEVFYGDQDFLDSEGRAEALCLRPDWSPVFCSAVPYIAGAAFVRAGTLKRFAGDVAAAEWMRAPDTIANIALREELSVLHIRRLLRTRRGASAIQSLVRNGADLARAPAGVANAAGPCATLIIPTKDRNDLLARCIGSLRRKTSPQDIEVIVIDNGSRHARSQRFFAELSRDERFRVVTRRGPFNFSELCNDVAGKAKAPTLVFLNDDTEVVEAHWLETLLSWTRQSDIGAVGAKLLYPNGRLQHAGVVLGIDGRAGHFERMAGRDSPGYFGRLGVAHEVSAVTAACLAVEKRKFAEVGGFDAVNLPVELNDIDLCLRLAERGWKTICASDAVLIHHESASRGRTLRPDDVYRKEHHYFRSRWMHRLRDDPYFHPALSLDRLDAALG